ncbi:MAG: peroxide stress protein YaaA [Acidimicrobiia bacterium]|nr:peroxide stress protein YaaA [Actinomycetota bacterium]MBL6925442.1 peroxide stress protein YaaA [Acidimicrobiia bacterium]MBL6926713.1 peroxide stress protein YaaA [Acidimicrobiia bacterium]
MSAPLILLPPSEGKATGGDGVPWREAVQSFPELTGSRDEVIAALTRAMKGSVEERSKILGVGAARTAEATTANLAVGSSSTLPAIERYTGVLYDALGYTSLSAALRRRVDRQVVIFSGLWGVLRPTDQIPDYKLKMGASLPGFGKPARFWKPVITGQLAGTDVVWDLLPNEHSAAWDPTVAGQRIRVRFLDEVDRGGERRLVVVSHWNKLLKGSLVRFLAESRADDPGQLVDFEHPEGYSFDPSLTTTSGATTDVALVARR